MNVTTEQIIKAKMSCVYKGNKYIYIYIIIIIIIII